MANDNKIVFIDDTVDVGKEPMVISDPEIQKLYDEFLKECK